MNYYRADGGVRERSHGNSRTTCEWVCSEKGFIHPSLKPKVRAPSESLRGALVVVVLQRFGFWLLHEKSKKQSGAGELLQPGERDRQEISVAWTATLGWHEVCRSHSHDWVWATCNFPYQKVTIKENKPQHSDTKNVTALLESEKRHHLRNGKGKSELASAKSSQKTQPYHPRKRKFQSSRETAKSGFLCTSKVKDFQLTWLFLRYE